jgi:omega-6 fatty acid desaturase (delta-12 desaturase)
MQENKSPNWQKIVKPYTVPDHAKSWWQVANTLIPFFVLWVLAYKSLAISYWLTFAICVVAQAFVVRTFIIMHDCGHGSFFKSRRLRTIVGYITGILTFTPYWQWTRAHATHHSTSGNLDKRGTGDVWTATVEEYAAMTPWQRFGYKVYRFPLVNFVIGPVYIFQIRFRFFDKGDGPREKRSVIITNIALAAIIGTVSYFVGFKNFLLVQVPITVMCQIFGCWLFYVQHQYEDVYWRHEGDWDYFESAMKGSSFFKLPKVLQWASGNIGFHHLHHLSHQIPNYNLEKCHNENAIFQKPTTIGLFDSFKCASYKLYDEENKEMITFGQYRRRYPELSARKVAVSAA